jgi:hypothetical protein
VAFFLRVPLRQSVTVVVQKPAYYTHPELDVNSPGDSKQHQLEHMFGDGLLGHLDSNVSHHEP